MLRDHKSPTPSVIMRNESSWFEVKIKIGEGLHFNSVCASCYRLTCERKKYVYGPSYRHKLPSCEGVNFDITGFHTCSLLKKFHAYLCVLLLQIYFRIGFIMICFNFLSEK